MDKPFAITLDVGSSLANKTGSWRDERPQYVHRLPPCNHACPAGENIQQWLYHAESGDYETAWRELVKDNPLPAVMGRVCYHPCETACNRAQLDEAVGIHARRALPRRRGDQARLEARPPTPRRPASACSSSAPGPSGLSAAYHLTRRGHAVTIREAGPDGRRHDALRHPALPAAARRARRRDAAHPRPRRDARAEHEGHEHPARRCRTAASTPCSSPSARTSASAPTSPPARRRTSSTPSRCCAAWRARSARCSAGASSSTAAATPRSTPRARPSASARARRSSSTAARASACPRTTSRSRRPLEEGVMMKWLSTIKQADEGQLVLEKMELDETGFPQPTGETEELQADSLVLALGQEADLSLLDGVPGLEIEDGVVQVDRTHDDRPRRASSPAATWCPPSARSPSASATASRPRATSTRGCAARGSSTARAGARELRRAQRLVLRRRAEDRRARSSTRSVGSRASTRSLRGSTRTTRCSRRAAACRCGNCFGCDNCYGVCPDNAVLKVDEGDGYAFDLDYCKGCGICVEECPCGAIEMIPEEI